MRVWEGGGGDVRRDCGEMVIMYIVALNKQSIDTNSLSSPCPPPSPLDIVTALTQQYAFLSSSSGKKGYGPNT